MVAVATISSTGCSDDAPTDGDAGGDIGLAEMPDTTHDDGGAADAGPTDGGATDSSASDGGTDDGGSDFGEDDMRSEDGGGDTGTPGPFAGPVDEPVLAHLPDMTFPTLDTADYVFAGTPDDPLFAVSLTEVLVVFENGTTVGEANEFLGEEGATLVGSLANAGVVLLRLPSNELDSTMATVTALNAHPAVRVAVPEMAGAPERLPPHNIEPGLWEWGGTAGDPIGNWWLERIRAPQLWNLDTYVSRSASQNISVGIVDAGFTDVPMNMTLVSSHPDLGGGKTIGDPGVLAISESPHIHDHGTLVSGVIGAMHNGDGTEGINPWLTTIRGRSASFRSRHEATWGRQLEDFINLLAIDPDVRAVNFSMGLSGWYWKADWLDGMADGSFDPEAVEFGDLNGDGDNSDDWFWDTNGNKKVDPDEPEANEFAGIDIDGDGNDDTWAEVVDRWGDAYIHVDSFFATGLGGEVPVPGVRSNYFIVTSAGNAGQHYEAEHNDPIGNAAARSGGRFLSVESTDFDGARSSFSDIKGSVAAPGSCIRGPEADDAEEASDSDCASEQMVDSLHGTSSGTSFASPIVVGLIGAVWKLAPSLTWDQVRNIITGDATTFSAGGGATPRVDAFSAAMKLDEIRQNHALQSALVDVDDGSVDGNLRERAFGSESDPDGIATGDGRRGDGKIDMSDFRAFRDAYVSARAEASPSFSASFDGAATHFKRDFNQDGCSVAGPVSPAHPSGIPTPATCADHPAESLFSRFDFNGSSQIDLDGDLTQPPGDAVAPFGISPDTTCTGLNNPAGCLRDIDVLADDATGFWQQGTEKVNLAAQDAGCAPIPNEWSATALLADRDNDQRVDYLRSADVHVRLGDPVDDKGIIVGAAGNFDLHFQKCRSTAYDGIVTLPVYEQGTIHIDTTMVSSGTQRKVRLTAHAVAGEDFKLDLKFDSLEFSSTSRGATSPVINASEQTEQIARDLSVVSAYGTDTAATTFELDTKMVQLAEQTIFPESLLVQWLGDARVVTPLYDSQCISMNPSGDCIQWEGTLWGAFMSGPINP